MKRVLAGLSDIISPPRCLTCDAVLEQRENLPFCGACYSKLHFIQSSICPCCGIPVAGVDGGSHLCRDCIVSKSVYSAARAVGRYEPPSSKRSIGSSTTGEYLAAKLWGN